MPCLQYGTIAMSHTEDIPIMQAQSNLIVRPADMLLNASVRNRLQSHYFAKLIEVDGRYRQAMQKNHLKYRRHHLCHMHQTRWILKAYWHEVGVLLNAEAKRVEARVKAEENTRWRDTPPSHVLVGSNSGACDTWMIAEERMGFLPRTSRRGHEAASEGKCGGGQEQEQEQEQDPEVEAFLKKNCCSRADLEEMNRCNAYVLFGLRP